MTTKMSNAAKKAWETRRLKSKRSQAAKKAWETRKANATKKRIYNSIDG